MDCRGCKVGGGEARKLNPKNWPPKTLNPNSTPFLRVSLSIPLFVASHSSLPSFDFTLPLVSLLAALAFCCSRRRQ